MDTCISNLAMIYKHIDQNQIGAYATCVDDTLHARTKEYRKCF